MFLGDSAPIPASKTDIFAPGCTVK
jgi:hypothetical protein